jgi:hypothetical protein
MERSNGWLCHKDAPKTWITVQVRQLHFIDVKPNKLINCISLVLFLYWINWYRNFACINIKYIPVETNFYFWKLSLKILYAFVLRWCFYQNYVRSEVGVIIYWKLMKGTQVLKDFYSRKCKTMHFHTPNETCVCVLRYNTCGRHYINNGLVLKIRWLAEFCKDI